MTDSSVDIRRAAFAAGWNAAMGAGRALTFEGKRDEWLRDNPLPSPEQEPRWFQDEEMRRHSDELREPMREAMLDRMVEAWSDADAHHSIRDTCRDLLAAALAPPTAQSGGEKQ